MQAAAAFAEALGLAVEAAAVTKVAVATPGSEDSTAEKAAFLAATIHAADAAMALELQVADTATAVQALANVTPRYEAVDRVRAADRLRRPVGLTLPRDSAGTAAQHVEPFS